MRRRQILAARSFDKAVEAFPPVEQKAYDDMGDADLRAAFKTVIGKAPHWKMKCETMLEKLNNDAG